MSSALDIRAEHEALLVQLRALARPYRGGERNDSYSGSGRPFLNVSAPERRALIKAWLAAHRTASDVDLIAFADSHFKGETHEEKTLGALLLGYSARARSATTPVMVDGWLGRLNGWAEIDSLCASVFSAEDLANGWPGWLAQIEQFSGDADINKRRAALVFLTTPTRTSDDPRFAELGFAVIERLKSERDILITKAVSWLLRSMTARHEKAVTAYLAAEAATLPAIAVRETRTKLRTGTKSGRSATPMKRGA
jgi:3-methyladenine DNA glycosylase AlkD